MRCWRDTGQAYYGLKQLKKEMDALSLDESQKARQIDLLTYQLQELEAADLQRGELEELVNKRTLFQNSEKIALAFQEAKEAVSGNEESSGALQAVQTAADAIQEIVPYFKELQPLSERLSALTYELDDCAFGRRHCFAVQPDADRCTEPQNPFIIYHDILIMTELIVQSSVSHIWMLVMQPL